MIAESARPRLHSICRVFARVRVTSKAISNFRGLCTMKEGGNNDNSVSKEGRSNENSGLCPITDEVHCMLPRVSVRPGRKSSSSKVVATPEIEKKYVHRVYDAIAPHFSSTRFAKWPKVQAFLTSLPPGSLILDAGCGNGKYLGINPDCYFIGCDISGPLVKICADRGHEVLAADAVNLPYRSCYGDAAISIAVLHHLSTESRRLKAIGELLRVVKKHGLVLITVWAREQEDKNLLNKWRPLSEKYLDEWIGPGSPRVRNPSSPRNLESIPEAGENVVTSSGSDLEEVVSSEYFVPWHLPYHRVEVSGASASAVANGFARKDERKQAVVYDRYYHVFSEGELERLVSGVEGAEVVDKFYDKSNWCIILRKT